VVVNPGDIILADRTGIVSIPQAIAEELLDRLRRFKERNVGYVAAVRSGDFSNQWVDEILQAQNCPVISGEGRDEKGDYPVERISDMSSRELQKPPAN
jgi:hypothetical protein